MTARTLLAAAALVFAAALTPARAADVSQDPQPAFTDELRQEGQQIYFQRCSFCHGLLGDGEGPAAPFMDPRPRDFTLGTFKFRTTQSGELPQNSDLYRTVSRGLSGTAMQAFDDARIKNGLSEHQRWAVIAYIQTFAPEFDDEELDPVKTGKVVSLPKDRPAYSAEIVAQGKEVFLKAKCWECHGKSGRGDGQKSFDRKDDWGFPIRIRNVTHPWKIKAGDRVEDIYMRFSTGISGTPMPSFVKALSETKRWQLANFIKSLQYQRTSHQVLKALRLQGELPQSPDDERWQNAEPMDVILTGQAVAPPRWQSPSIEMVTLQAVFNDKEIAFRLYWDDPFKDTKHDTDQELDVKEISSNGIYNSYVDVNEMAVRKLETYRDAMALQFPVKPTEGTKRPHFLRGAASDPVHLWHWKSDLGAAEEAVGRGWRQALRPQPKDQQQISAKATWDQGRWQLVMKRPLRTEDKNDVQFEAGRFIPLALNAWDGSNGEHGLIMSLSSWYYVFLEAPTPISVYLYTILAILISGALGFWLMRKAEAEDT
ncbi:MAG TPA: ethylbenzene dehydrogenase-related protein [Alphaproteobacteria bacterium]|nr:ethylbenzene dehydrogenase-related protein [Alphaproteobacteria bacterium]